MAGRSNRKSGPEPYQWLGVGAIALGMGVALANGAGLAAADEPDSSAGSSQSSDSPPASRSESASVDNPPAAPSSTVGSGAADPDDATDSEPTHPDAADGIDKPADGDAVVPSTKDRAKRRATSRPTSHSTVNTQPAPQAPVAKAPRVSRTAPESQPDTAATTSALSVASTSIPTPSARAAESSVAPSAPPAFVAPAKIAADVFNTLSAALLGLGANGTTESPIAWMFLAAARRQLGGTAPDAVDTASRQTTAQALAAVNNSAPKIGSVTVGKPNTTTGVVTGTVKASDADKDPLIFTTSATSTKGGTVTINAATGAFTYTPSHTAQHAAAAAGASTATKSDTFTATVSDGLGGIASKVVTVTVSPKNSGPTLAAHPSVGSANPSTGVVTGTLGTSDADGDTVTLSAAPTKGTITFGSGGSFTYTPTTSARHAASASGASTATKSDTFTVTATDGYGGSMTKSVTVSVAPANAAPVVTTTTTGVPSTSTGAIKGQFTATDADKDTLTYSAITSAKGKVTISNKGAFTYTPTAVARHAAASTTASADDKQDVVTLTATDAHGGVTTTTVTVLLTPKNSAPTVKTSVGKPNSATGVVAGTVTATDSDKDLVTYSAPTTTANGAVTINASTGAFTYTPTPAARHAAAAKGAKTETFTVTVSDHFGGTAATSITVTISPTNTGPTVAANPTVGAPNPTTGAVTGTLGATDADGDTLTFTAAPAKGAITFGAGGAFTYTPTAAARHAAAVPGAAATAKSETLTVTVSDSHGGTVTKSLTVAITPVNNAPANGAVTVGTPNASTGAVTGTVKATDLDGDALKYTAPSKTGKGSVSVNVTSGAFTYTPTTAARHAAAAPGAATTDTFTMTASDGYGGTVPITVTVSILPKNSAPAGGKATVGETNTTTGVVTGTLSATDADGDRLTYTAPASTTKGAVTIAGSTFSYTPTLEARIQARDLPSTASQDTFTVTASDGYGGTTTIAVKVTIAPPDAFTNIPVKWAAEPTEKSEPDPVTGVVIGRLATIDDKSWTVRYSLVSGPDPAAGTLDLESFTEFGFWRFTPNPDARVATYYGDAGPRTATFIVRASDGESQTAPLTISVPITPSAAQQVLAAPTNTTFTGVAVVGTDGTVYRGVRAQTSTDPTRFESWIVGVRPDSTTIETAHVAGTFSGTVAGEFGAYAMVNDTAAASYRVIGFTANGTPVNYTVQVTGSTLGLPVSNAFGVYQLFTDYQQNTTTLITLAGQGAPNTVIAGTSNAASNTLTSGPLGVYLTTYDSSTKQTRVSTIAGEGPPTTIVNGWPGNSVQPAGLVAGPQGVYLTVLDLSTPRTTVVRIVGQGPASTVITGYPEGPVVMGPDGVYQTTDTTYTTGERIARIVTITGTGPALTQFNGEARGPVVVGDFGVYQQLYDAASGKTTVMRITGTGPASTVIDGYIQTIVAGKHGVYAVNYKVVGQGFLTTMTKVAGYGVSTATASGTPASLVDTERGAYLVVTGGQTSVLTLAGEGAPVTVLAGGTYTNSLRADNTGVYQFVHNSYLSSTVYAIVGGGPASVVIPGAISTLTLAPNGTGYYASSDSGVYFVDTTRQVPGAAGFVVDGTHPTTGVVTGHVTAPNPNNETLTYAVTQSPGSSVGTVSVNPATGTFTFAPTGAARHAAWSTPYPDTATFTITATGATTNAAITVVTTISPANQAPTASGVTITGTDATTGIVSGKVNVTDSDGDPLTYSVGTAPGASVGNVSVNTTTGTFTFTPTASSRHNAWATTGIDTTTFVINATDGGAVTPITVTATITPANVAPTTSGFTITGTNTSTGVVTGKVNATDADGDALTYTLGSPMDARLGTLSLNSTTGVFTFTPTRTALVSAWGSVTPQLADFSVVATDGELSATVAVAAPITASTESIAGVVARTGSLPAGVAVGQGGRVYVVNAGANSVSVLNASGVLQSVTTVGLAPVDVLVAPDGRVWVANAGDGTVTVLNANGTVVGSAITVGASPVALASDSAGRVYVANASAGTVSVIEAGATAIGRTITVGGTPTDVAVSAGRLYVTDFAGGVLTVIDTANGDARKVITGVGANPFSVTVKPDGRVYVTNPSNGTVTVLTPGGNAYVPSTIAVGGVPSTITLRANGDVLVADAAGSTVWVVDATTSAVTKVSVGDNPSGIAVAADGTVYVVNSGSDSLTVLRPAQPSATVDVGVDTSVVTVNYDGKTMTVVDKYTGTVSTLRAGWQPPVSKHPAVTTVIPANIAGPYPGANAISVSPDGHRVYIAGVDATNTTAITVVDVATNVQIDRFTLSARRIGDMAVSPDGTRLYLVGETGNTFYTRVIVVDIATRAVIAEVPFTRVQEGSNTADGIYGLSIAVSPNGRYVYATSITDQTWFFYEAGGVAITGGPLTVLAVVDTATNTVVRQLIADHNSAVAVNPNGSAVYVTGESLSSMAGQVLFRTLSPGTNTVSSALRMPNQGGDGNSGSEDGVAVTSDGGVAYVANQSFVDGVGNRGFITKVNTRTGTVISSFQVADSVSDVAISPNDRYLVISGFNSGQTVAIVIDTTTNAVLAKIPVGSATDIAFTPDSRYAYVVGSQRDSTGNAYRGYVSVIDMNIVAPPVPSTPTPPNPIPPDPTRADYGDVAPSLAYLWNTLKDKTTDGSDTNEGIYIQTVEGTVDGKHRLIVYLGGTTQDWLVNQGVLENLVVASTKAPKPEHIRAINDAITKCTSDSKCGSIEEVMLVGYSQGGIDAQNLAWRGNSQMVTTVITFGSPLVDASRSDDVTLHIRDVFDEVVNLTAVHPLFLYGALASANDISIGNAGTIFQVNPFNPIATLVHGNNNTYLTLSSRLDTEMAGPNTTGKLGAVEAKLNLFKGIIRDESEGDEFSSD